MLWFIHLTETVQQRNPVEAKQNTKYLVTHRNFQRQLSHMVFCHFCIKSPKIMQLLVGDTEIASPSLPWKNSLKTTHTECKRKASHFHSCRGNIIIKAAYFFQIYNFILNGILPNSQRKNWAKPLICKNLFHLLLSRWTTEQLQQRTEEMKHNQSLKY